jgi:hypothetical protein
MDLGHAPFPPRRRATTGRIQPAFRASGREPPHAVTPAYRTPFSFTGTINRVEADIATNAGPEPPQTLHS